MPVHRHFIEKNLNYVRVNEYLQQELKMAGHGKIEIHKTPMGHRVIIHAVRLGMVIGRRGRNIRKITTALEHDFGLETPQIEVRDLDNPRLNSKVMASRLISQIQKGFHFRRAGYSLVRRIMSSGARGCEIVIKGKLTSQRARSEVFRAGFVAKCGEPADKWVDEAVLEVTLKQGVIGVHIKIMQPDAELPDEAEVIEGVFPEEDVFAELAEESPEEVSDENLNEDEIIHEIIDSEETSTEEVTEEGLLQTQDLEEE